MSSLVGLWIFVGFIYQGRDWPPPNPQLHLQFEFEASGVNTLKYWREGERGICERRAKYRYQAEQLWQQVIWVNPENPSDCGRDPDMQNGKISWSGLRMGDQKIYLEVPLGDERLIYVWERRD